MPAGFLVKLCRTNWTCLFGASEDTVMKPNLQSSILRWTNCSSTASPLTDESANYDCHSTCLPIDQYTTDSTHNWWPGSTQHAADWTGVCSLGEVFCRRVGDQSQTCLLGCFRNSISHMTHGQECCCMGWNVVCNWNCDTERGSRTSGPDRQRWRNCAPWCRDTHRVLQVLCRRSFILHVSR